MRPCPARHGRRRRPARRQARPRARQAVVGASDSPFSGVDNLRTVAVRRRGANPDERHGRVTGGTEPVGRMATGQFGQLGKSQRLRCSRGTLSVWRNAPMEQFAYLFAGAVLTWAFYFVQRRVEKRPTVEAIDRNQKLLALKQG